jgi:hypothetical protein
MTENQLPPDPDGFNDVRAKFAKFAVTTFRRKAASSDPSVLGLKYFAAIMLCHMMHWFDRQEPRAGEPSSFDEALEWARRNYREETKETASATPRLSSLPASDQ